MANLTCQHDNIWNQLKLKMLQRIVLIRLSQTGSPTLNLGHTFWCQFTRKNKEEGSFAFACLHPFVDKFIYPAVSIPSLVLEPTSL